MDALLLPSLGIGRWNRWPYPMLEPFHFWTLRAFDNVHLPIAARYRKQSHDWVGSVPHGQNYNTISIPLLGTCRTGFQPGSISSFRHL